MPHKSGRRDYPSTKAHPKPPTSRTPTARPPTKPKPGAGRVLGGAKGTPPGTYKGDWIKTLVTPKAPAARPKGTKNLLGSPQKKGTRTPAQQMANIRRRHTGAFAKKK